MARKWFGEAVDAQRNGRTAEAFVRVGEVSHLIQELDGYLCELAGAPMFQSLATRRE